MSPQGGWGLVALWISHKDRVWAWHYQSWAWAWNWGINLVSSTPPWHYQSWAWAWNVAVILLISTAAHHHNLPFERTFESSPATLGDLPFDESFESSSAHLGNLPYEKSFDSSANIGNLPLKEDSESATAVHHQSVPSKGALESPLPVETPTLPSVSPSRPIVSSSLPNISISLHKTPTPPNTTKLVLRPNFHQQLPNSKPQNPVPLPEPPKPVAPQETVSGNMADVMLCKVILASAILVFWTAFWIIHLIGIIYGYRRLHQRRGGGVEGAAGNSNGQVEGGMMGVSILKPLVGTPMDPHLATNLETFFTLNYPKFELLFCIQEDGDPTIAIVEQLMKKYPDVNASYFTGGKEVGVNPKINNMQPGYVAAQHELLLVSDSGLMMKEDTLSDMVAHMTPEVGIVHQMPFCCDRKGWPAVLEKVYFGTSHARMYLFLGLLDALGLKVNCCTGMSCLMRKKVLDELGGISEFGKYLAEDYFFAKCIQEKGWGIRIASQPAWQNAGLCRVKTFLSRLTRWCKLRIAMVPHTLLLEPFSECMVLGLVASWGACVLLRADYLTFFLFHTLTWSLADWIMLNIVQNGTPPFTKFEFAVSWLFREASALFLFLHAVWNPVISWRAGAFKLHWWGRAELISKKVTVM